MKEVFAMETYKVKLEPVGIELEVREDETVLDAAFRQGVMPAHGCREGRCSACKSFLLQGDYDLEDYSTFALPDFEREQGYVLLCKMYPVTDLCIELIHYSEELLRMGTPIRKHRAQVESIESLTHDIRLLTVKLLEPEEMLFRAGQYVELEIPGTGVVRSYSMANTPRRSDYIQCMIKVFQGGKFSSLLEGQLQNGQELTVTGPYGTLMLREGEGEVLMVGGGSGMGPLWSLLNDIMEQGIRRKVTFFYGARACRDLFYLEKFAELERSHENFHFIPALSSPQPEDEWSGERGYIHEVLDRYPNLPTAPSKTQAYLCGPEAMIDAVIAVLKRKGYDDDQIFWDKFVPTGQ
jgi:propane monooxygenase reductase subunit